jgi:hypothetical protein
VQKDELIANMRRGYADFTLYIRAHDPTQLTILTDDAGWTVKDHAMHAVMWEESIYALLNRLPRAERMGIDPALIAAWDVEAINAAIQHRTRYLSVGDALRRFEETHTRVMAAVEALSQAELEQPLGNFLPEAPEQYKGDPIYLYIAGNSYEHYEEHRPWLDAIVAQPESVTERAVVLARMRKAWDYLHGYITALDEHEATEPTDAAGWTPKDHVMHLAVWEGGVAALLDRQDRLAYMGIDAALWAAHDYDAINAVIQQRHRDLSWEEVKRRLEESHQRLIAKVEALSQADLLKPYGNYLPIGQENDDGDPVVNRIAGNTFAHYPEHIEWIDAIIQGG